MSYYCSGSYLKRKLYIADADNSFNVQITGSIFEASAYLNSILGQYTIVPLSTVSQLLQYCCADFAASIFRNDQLRNARQEGSLELNAGVTDVFWQAGTQKLNDYIQSTFKSGSMLSIATGSDL